MEAICKAAVVQKAAELGEEELALINAQTLRPMTAAEVFAFKLAACDDQVDRDFERFTGEALEQMAKLYVGRPVLRDHAWMEGSQTARVYAAGVEQCGEGKRLVLRCYMPRTEGAAETVAAIESGVLRECSVGLRVGKSICSICGAVQQTAMCRHYPGREYGGKLCHFDLDDIQDAYEVSLVAVPAQPEAGIIKSKLYGCEEPEQEGREDSPQDNTKAIQAARARLALEKIRFGGN